MTFTGNEDHDITLTEAAALTKNYRDSITAGDTIAHYFGKTAIIDLLDQEDAVGLRIYYGKSTDGGKQLVVTAVDEDGNDMYEGILLDRSVRCPQDCASANPLNTTINNV